MSPRVLIVSERAHADINAEFGKNIVTEIPSLDKLIDALVKVGIVRTRDPKPENQ